MVWRYWAKYCSKWGVNRWHFVTHSLVGTITFSKGALILYETIASEDPMMISSLSSCMGLLPDTQNCGVCMRRECRVHFPRLRGLAILTRITTRALRTCRDACRDRQIAVSFKVGGGENVPGIPGACATHTFPYLVHVAMCLVDVYLLVLRQHLQFGVWFGRTF